MGKAFLCMLFCALPLSVLGLQSALVGNGADVITVTSPGVVLMGGGTDVDRAFQWMIERSGGGDFVVIRWGALGSYNNYIYRLGTVNSVETIQFDSRQEAFDDAVVAKVRNAEALWIAGGDQGNYVNGWKDTPIEDAINYLLKEKKCPVGGTSAGCAIMTPIYWGATSGSWPQYETANEALMNPFQSGRNGMGFNDFLDAPYLQNTISDQHFEQRNRQQRLIAQMAYAFSRGYSPIKGIGCNEATAVCIDADGMAVVYGQSGGSRAFFCRQYCGGPEVYSSGQPLTWRGGLKVYVVSSTAEGSGRFNLVDWQTCSGGKWEYWTIEAGTWNIQPQAPFACTAAVEEQNLTHNFKTKSPGFPLSYGVTPLGRIVPAYDILDYWRR